MLFVRIIISGIKEWSMTEKVFKTFGKSRERFISIDIQQDRLYTI